MLLPLILLLLTASATVFQYVEKEKERERAETPPPGFELQDEILDGCTCVVVLVMEDNRYNTPYSYQTLL